MNKVGRFLLAGFALSVLMIVLSIASAQSTARKLAKHDQAEKIVLSK